MAIPDRQQINSTIKAASKGCHVGSEVAAQLTKDQQEAAMRELASRKAGNSPVPGRVVKTR